MDSKLAEKKIERISKQQKQKLVNYMASNLEFARGQFGAANAYSSLKEEWASLTTSLNSLGGSEKTAEQWKKCWSDLKSGVKKAVNARRKYMNQTGGGSWADVPRDLNPIEEQILQIITVDAVDGDSSTPESGIKLTESFEDFMTVEFLEGEETYMPQPKKMKGLEAPTTSAASAENFYKKPIAASNTPKYREALDEARGMQKEVMEKLNKVEAQNSEILAKLDEIENLFNTHFK